MCTEFKICGRGGVKLVMHMAVLGLKFPDMTKGNDMFG